MLHRRKKSRKSELCNPIQPIHQPTVVRPPFDPHAQLLPVDFAVVVERAQSIGEVPVDLVELGGRESVDGGMREEERRARNACRGRDSRA